MDEDDIQDLSNSILEVSSTVASFSSPPEDKARDDSIEEIPSSPEIETVAEVTQLSEAEVTRIRKELEQKQLLMKSCRLDQLPDGGRKIVERIRQLRETLEAAAKAPPKRPVPASTSTRSSEQQEDELRKQLQMKKVSPAILFN